MKHAICILTFIFLTSTVFAWSPSHKRLLKELDNLVPFIKKKLSAEHKKKLYNEYFNYPDKRLNITADMVGQEELEYLKEQQIVNTLTLHNAEALPHMFYLLVKALKGRDYNKVTFWVACISHNLNDSASPHFIPGIYSFDIMKRNFDLATADGKKVNDYVNAGLYVETVFNKPAGAKLLKKMYSEYKFKSIGSNAADASLYISTLPYYLRNASFTHASYLMDNIQRNIFTAKPQTHNGSLATAKMAITGITATADVLNTAWNIVEKRQRFRSSDIDMEIIKTEINAILQRRTLSQLPIFKDVLPNDKKGGVGILTESYYRFKDSSLGFASRILSASIMGTLKKSGQQYRALDLKDVLKTSLPSPEEMPILIIPACNLNPGYRWIKKRNMTKLIQKYTAAGGRIMWISSSKMSHLGDLSFNIKESGTTEGFSYENLSEGQVFANNILKTEGKDSEVNGIKAKSFPFKTIPSDKFEWLEIKSTLIIKNAENIIPLMFFKDLDDSTYTVAAYEQREDDSAKANYICISSLFFFPYIYSNVTESISETQLDKQSSHILLAALNLLK